MEDFWRMQFWHGKGSFSCGETQTDFTLGYYDSQFFFIVIRCEWRWMQLEHRCWREFWFSLFYFLFGLLEVYVFIATYFYVGWQQTVTKTKKNKIQIPILSNVMSNYICVASVSWSILLSCQTVVRKYIVKNSFCAIIKQVKKEMEKSQW